MMTQLSNLRWRRILLAASLVYLISFLIVFCVILAYAFMLGFRARGAPDPAQIQQFANQAGPWGGRIGVVILTVAAAAWVARRVESAAQVHGILVGVIVGIPNLIFGGPPSWGALATVILAIGAGWLGSIIGSQRS